MRAFRPVPWPKGHNSQAPATEIRRGHQCGNRLLRRLLPGSHFWGTFMAAPGSWTTDVSQFLFPIDKPESILRRNVAPSLERSNGMLRWAAGDGISELSVTPIQVR